MREGGGIAGAIAGMIVALLVFLPFILVVVLYLFFSAYAIAKGGSFGAATLNPAVFFTAIVLLSAVPVVLLMAAVTLLGRGLSPRRATDS